MTLADEYYQAEARPADVVHDFRRQMMDENNNNAQEAAASYYDFLKDDKDGTLLAFVIPNVLSGQECDDLIQQGEDFGIQNPPAAAGTLRTAKRTKNYQNQALSETIQERLHATLKTKLEPDGMGQVHGIHANWRVVRYDQGDSYCAHQDQMDSQQRKHQDGTKDFIISSHTLLINLSKDGAVKCGGATRFYPRSAVQTTKSGQYEHAEDVYLPRGWGLVFRQKGLVHAGQPVMMADGGGDGDGGSSKYVAQAGILRLLPNDVMIQPSVFRLGPGLQNVVEQRGYEYHEKSGHQKQQG